MDCEQVRKQLGPYLDGELPSAAPGVLEGHLATCDSCREELESLRAIASELAAPGDVAVPEALWTAIEGRLDGGVSQERSSEPRARATGGTPRAGAWGSGVVSRARTQSFRPIRRWVSLPSAVAAAVVLAVGLGIFGLVWTGSTARASSVDFSILLDALPLDAQKAFRKFLVRYDARDASPVEARRYAPDLNFDVPEVLPGGFRLEAVYLLRFGEHAGIAATYDRDGEFLGAVFHPPVQREAFGTHRDYPCIIGKHRGHKVEVGEWKLVHLTDPTTCHCILSRLNEETELPGIMAAVTPILPAPGAELHDH